MRQGAAQSIVPVQCETNVTAVTPDGRTRSAVAERTNWWTFAFEPKVSCEGHRIGEGRHEVHVLPCMAMLAGSANMNGW